MGEGHFWSCVLFLLLLLILFVFNIYRIDPLPDRRKLPSTKFGKKKQISERLANGSVVHSLSSGTILVVILYWSYYCVWSETKMDIFFHSSKNENQESPLLNAIMRMLSVKWMNAHIKGKLIGKWRIQPRTSWTRENCTDQYWSSDQHRGVRTWIRISKPFDTTSSLKNARSRITDETWYQIHRLLGLIPAPISIAARRSS